MPTGGVETEFAISWDTFVAVGTLALAAATFWLAKATRATAGSAADDVRAQWRPAIVPGRDIQVDYLPDDREILVFLRNAGRGPAFYLRVGLAVGEQVIPAEAMDPDRTDLWNSAVIRVDEELDLRFRGIDRRPDTCDLVADYLDIADRPYNSRIAISRYAGSDRNGSFDFLRMTRVQLTQGDQVTPWGVP